MNNRGPTIYIVDDDVSVCRALSLLLKSHGFKVQTFTRSADFLACKHPKVPSCLVLDIRLPDIDGYEVARRVRTDRRTNEIPIIFLTEKRERVDRLQGFEVGADDYITKPFDVQELRLRVRNALKRVSQGSLTNPVSGLPEGGLVDERLSEVIHKSGWALLHISISQLESFREAYGFVASDDVLRAISLMIVNTMREVSRPEDFLGHLSVTDFIIVLPPSNLVALGEKLRSRLEQSMEYFYPIKDREQMAQRKNRLGAALTEIPSFKEKFASLEEAKAELLNPKS